MAAESDKSIDALERSLIAERHERLRLDANVKQAMFDKGRLDGQLNEVRAKVEILADENASLKDALQEEGASYRSLRQKLFLIMIVIIVMSACIVAGLSTAIVYLLK